MFCRCFIVNVLMSKKRSAQFAMQLSSLLSSLLFLIDPVMHFLKQTSVREWTAGRRGKDCQRSVRIDVELRKRAMDVIR